MAERRWTPPTTVAAAVFVALAILLVALPIQATQQPRPARFGWQMYSTISPVPEVWTEDATGTRTSVDPARYMGDGRAEIIWAHLLADALCGDADVRSVIVSERGTEERIPCS